MKKIYLIPGSMVASGTLLVYDLLCTLDQEVEHVWSQPFSFSSLLFFLNRYLPFVDTFISLDLHMSVSSPEKCLRNTKVFTWFIACGILLCEIILMLRTYAIWERRRSVLYGFIILFTCVAVPSFVFIDMELKSLIYERNSEAGCNMVYASPIIMGSYMLLLLCETVIATLMAIKAWQHLRRPHSSWVSSLYLNNGLLYYFYAFCLTLANVLVPILNRDLANWLATPQRVLHSIFCTRILLLIQKQRNTQPHSPSLFSSILDAEPLDSTGSSSFMNSFSFGGVSTGRSDVTTSPGPGRGGLELIEMDPRHL